MGRWRDHVVALTILAVGLLSISAIARPCKTFLISSYSFSFQNPNDPSSSASSGFVTIFTEIRQLKPVPIPSDPNPKPSYVLRSLRERSRDILSVVVALLFGVGCGALTAATLYLVWTLFSARFEYHRACLEEDESDEEFSPKKMGYVNIPAVNVEEDL
ncbi:uncharacterized protein LOC111305828 [Durio zibethinus]|uniref:Uncharacterized protein LOC111305828 n=1 Tax=Durio zibethinus TaxID=66656 RepID=A0A6P6A3R5_DURZI|nr:uncharacterized protein LOC111305828 [Durio zibethinus]